MPGSPGRRRRRTFGFERVWWVPATPDRVFAALHDLGAYPTWWPQIREVTRHTEDSGVARIRSALPYSLAVGVTREVVDAANGRLRVGLSGDLVGWAEFVVEAGSGGWSVATFSEQVQVGVGWLSPFDRVLEPVLRANHEVMMRSGERGLRRLLADES